MTILKQNNEESYGNDCLIYRSIALIELYGSYIVLEYEKVTGQVRHSSSNTVNFSDYNNAAKYYDKLLKGEL